MRRAAICGAIAAALVAAAVAVGAGTDVRIHRLHVPPPPVGDDSGTSVPPAAGKPNPTTPTDPSVPGTSPPAAAAARGCAAASSTCRSHDRLQRRGRRRRRECHGNAQRLRDRPVRALGRLGAHAHLPRYLPGRWRHPQPDAPRRGLDQALRHEQPQRRPGRHVHGHEPAAGQLPARVHDPRRLRHDEGLHRQLTARGVRRRARGRRHAAAARASSRRATRPSWPRPRARRRRDGGR